VTEVPDGNRPSFEAMSAMHESVRDAPDALLLNIEEDYYFSPRMIPALVAFFHAYEPCAACVVDYPDRYTKTDNQRWGQEAIVRTAERHWRTVETSPITKVYRLDVFHALHARGHITTNEGGYINARWVGEREHLYTTVGIPVGLWAPMPGLASHIHNDHTGPLEDPAFDYVRFEREMLRTPPARDFPR
jgi:hypothetical protein